VVDRVEPTCTTEGKTGYRVCASCKLQEGEQSVLPVSNHLYHTTYTYPTVTSAGSKTRVCKFCGDTKTTEIAALSVALPKASDILAEIIGAFAATIEITEGSELSFITKPHSPDGVGFKRSVFFEVAEAAINTKGEKPQGHLLLKVGTITTELNNTVSENSSATNKDGAEYVEICIYVNGDDISIELSGNETHSTTVSEEIYGAIAKLLGLNGYEDLLKVMYLELTEGTVTELLEKVLMSVMIELPTISPEYVQHLGTLLALVGEEIVDETIDGNGNSIYTLNIAALKKLTEEIDGKTLSEYLNGVYGEDVVGAYSSFLKSLPGMTLKQIADVAIDVAEAVGGDISDLYTYLDLYVYFTTGAELNLETLIATYYDMTLPELMGMMAGVPEEYMAEFIQKMTLAFNNTANMLQTMTVDNYLSMMLLGTEEGFIKSLNEQLDKIDSDLKIEIILDADGNLIDIKVPSRYSVNAGYTVTYYLALICGTVVSQTTDDDGNTVYSFDLSALEALLEEAEIKTVAEYVAELYGEDMIGMLAAFLNSLSDMTVKEIADKAVAFAEGMGVHVSNVYTLIDLYVYLITGEQFSIENEIASNYTLTIPELLANLSDVPAEEKAAFIQAMKKSLTMTADTLQNTTVDQLLSMMLFHEKEGGIDYLLRMIGMIDEAITADVTVDANGNLLSILLVTGLGTADLKLDANGNVTAILLQSEEYGTTVEYTFAADQITMNILDLYGYSFTVCVLEKGATVLIKEGDSVIGGGNLTVAENGDITANFEYDGFVSLAYTQTAAGATLTCETGIELAFTATADQDSADITVSYENETVATGNLTIDENRNLSLTLKMVAAEGVELTVSATEDTLTLLVAEEGVTIGNGYLTYTETVDGENTTIVVAGDLLEGENDLLDVSLVVSNGILTEAELAIRGYSQPNTGESAPSNTPVSPATVTPEAESEELITLFGIHYQDLGENGLKLTVTEYDIKTVIQAGLNELDFSVFDEDEKVAQINLSYVDTVLKLEILDIENTLLLFSATVDEQEKTVTGASLLINDYRYAPNSSTPELYEVLNVGFEVLENIDGEMNAIRVEYQGTSYILGYQMSLGEIHLMFVDEEMETVVNALRVIADGETVSFGILSEIFGETLIDLFVNITNQVNSDAYEVMIEIELGNLILGVSSTESYSIAFNGGFKLKIG
jgi:hypothetical protein